MVWVLAFMTPYIAVVLGPKKLDKLGKKLGALTGFLFFPLKLLLC